MTLCKTTRLFSFLAVLCLGLVAGCGGGGEDEATTLDLDNDPSLGGEIGGGSPTHDCDAKNDPDKVYIWLTNSSFTKDIVRVRIYNYDTGYFCEVGTEDPRLPLGLFGEPVFYVPPGNYNVAVDYEGGLGPTSRTNDNGRATAGSVVQVDFGY